MAKCLGHGFSLFWRDKDIDHGMGGIRGERYVLEKVFHRRVSLFQGLDPGQKFHDSLAVARPCAGFKAAGPVGLDGYRDSFF